MLIFLVNTIRIYSDTRYKNIYMKNGFRMHYDTYIYGIVHPTIVFMNLYVLYEELCIIPNDITKYKIEYILLNRNVCIISTILVIIYAIVVVTMGMYYNYQGTLNQKELYSKTIKFITDMFNYFMTIISIIISGLAISLYIRICILLERDELSTIIICICVLIFISMIYYKIVNSYILFTEDIYFIHRNINSICNNEDNSIWYDCQPPPVYCEA